MTTRFELRFDSTESLLVELDSNLRRGRTFLPGQLAPADRSPCVVCVQHPETGTTVELSGEVVFAQTEGAHVGVGVDLVDPDLAERLMELAQPSVAGGHEPTSQDQPEAALDLDFDLVDPALEVLGEDLASEGPSESARPSTAPDSRRGITVHERVRKLTPAARDKLARTGNLSERVALERAFGASVWEFLLENAQITGAELAKIARNGLAPVPILSHIAGHAGWLAKPEVRRALLSNARLPVAQAERVLRSLPPTELRLVPAQAGYPAAVRAAARRMLQR